MKTFLGICGAAIIALCVLCVFAAKQQVEHIREFHCEKTGNTSTYMQPMTIPSGSTTIVTMVPVTQYEYQCDNDVKEWF